MSLTPFIRHELEHQPGTTAAPENSCTRCTPAARREPAPCCQTTPLPPAHRCRRRSKHRARPAPGHKQRPAGCAHDQRHPGRLLPEDAREFLAGDVQTSVMAHYAPGLFSTDQHTHSCHPAPDEDASQVLSLVDWREDAPYG